MQRKELSICLKVLDAVTAAGCLWFILYYLPHGGFAYSSGVLDAAPFEVWPIRTSLLAAAAALPVVGIGVLCWQVFTQIGLDRSYSMYTARRLRHVSVLALVEAVVFIFATAVCSFVQVLVFGLFALLLVCIIASLGLAIVAAAISHLVLKEAVGTGEGRPAE